ncbi:hypothetical protein L227DRAFT_565018 [Lentinus tigrinus ALCF2SS1-6]|uniref:Uncharacterized protein n=1 Tax=Lentinus tigrinus ALCF2SS1-6 TaxID=1328759 RepID=A0A5C2S3P1_9APHY|nr:hypothetical protein L227DRAFT_565018 [Lentinus tigrinus ALCF2SS1-6]
MSYMVVAKVKHGRCGAETASASAAAATLRMDEARGKSIRVRVGRRRRTGGRRVRKVPAGQTSHLRLRLSATALALGPEGARAYAGQRQPNDPHALAASSTYERARCRETGTGEAAGVSRPTMAASADDFHALHRMRPRGPNMDRGRAASARVTYLPVRARPVLSLPSGMSGCARRRGLRGKRGLHDGSRGSHIADELVRAANINYGSLGTPRENLKI